jgi:hypothetical protein
MMREMLFEVALVLTTSSRLVVTQSLRDIDLLGKDEARDLAQPLAISPVDGRHRI